MDISPEYYSLVWYIVGVALIITDIAAFSLMGLLFTGLGALTTGLLLDLNIINDGWMPQTIAFLGATALWALVLWNWLKGLRTGKGNVKNVVGDIAVVEKAFDKNGKGTVRWSGTTMKALLIEGKATAGDEVEVIEIKGTTLKVKGK